ncbi:hypothetical protein Lalb_Chr22g0360941 [Lupinus albus]|uniref:Uncharacterized protein n=1 Tax=Lupinus albus TaxID=3870 RepID=A0A6A4N353_LUPAL|nr:hypothetical protein Lalb_Chr22g0360941 [Lupinus albus]
MVTKGRLGDKVALKRTCSLISCCGSFDGHTSVVGTFSSGEPLWFLNGTMNLSC